MKTRQIKPKQQTTFTPETHILHKAQYKKTSYHNKHHYHKRQQKQQ